MIRLEDCRIRCSKVFLIVIPLGVHHAGHLNSQQFLVLGTQVNTRFYLQPTDDSAGSHKPIPANGLRRNVVSKPIVKWSCACFFGESGNQQALFSNGVLLRFCGIVQNSCRRTGQGLAFIGSLGTTGMS